MARNKRTCEQCGGFSSPHIPRERVDGKLLCQGCAAVAKTRTAAKKTVNTPAGPGSRKQKPSQTADFWDGDLAPREDLHPLMQPLPNSVWEKFNQHRELLGKPKTFLTAHLKEAEERAQEPSGGDSEPYSEAEPKRRFWRRRKASLAKTADGPEHGAQHLKPGPELIQHLQDHHGASPALAHIQGKTMLSHGKLHDAGADHTHGPNGEVVQQGAESEKPHPSTMSPQGYVDHMVQDHGWTPENAKTHADAGMENALSQHKTDHEVDAEGYHNLTHTHQGLGELPHPQGTNELSMHLMDHHGVDDWELHDLDHADLQDKHDQFHHSTAYSGKNKPEHTHPEGVAEKETVGEEPGQDGPEELKHPSKFTTSSMHGHLLEDHGIDPDHLKNAVDGTFEATDPSHVVHMLHNAAHKNGQVQFEHSHENWTGGPEIHPGHTDQGQPFWGQPPTTAQKSHEHLTAKKSQGGHGLSPDDLAQMAKQQSAGPMLEDSEYHKAYEQIHGNLHQQGGVKHQHVPTVQPGVMSPEKAKKEQIKQHLKEHHGVEYSANPELSHSELHDSEAYAYNGHPGHEHIPWDKHGPMLQQLPGESGHDDHPANMSATELKEHIGGHHLGQGTDESSTMQKLQFHVSNAKASHEELLQQHALMHASGATDGHTHEPVGNISPLEDVNTHYGTEPEIQTDTHPAVTEDHEALVHIIQHHPNVTQDEYQSWAKHNNTGKKPSMVAYHEALHTPGAKTTMGNTLPKVLDGHDHAEETGPPTQISVGSHLVHEHGVDQATVASMTPAQFKAHHEQLHLKESELDIGHGHDYPGGPQRDPRVVLPNTHHQLLRNDDRHPAVQEWYHGTGTDYEGAPKNATELKSGHGFWGNFGGGDWNNHVGTHWTALHEMAQDFNEGGNRVIHARLHIRNPIVYNSLNHMAHDAYERLRASGHLQDDGRYENDHSDETGYNECCSKRLLEYAKGHHRDDGKFGLEAYRDSLRASGHDGIHVRNQADNPEGHWNAIPLSADQIEITHGGCRGTHGDERDDDVDEFKKKSSRLTKGWVHPKHFSPDDYVGARLDHLPTSEEVEAAHQAKREMPVTNKTATGRGDSDPYLDHDPDDDDDDDDDKWCEHCDDYTNHVSDDCTVSKWCNVCDEHGSHTTSEEHPWCIHCDGYADHESEDCNEDPDNWAKEAYCPHCDKKHKENLHSEECTNCGEKLPDWGKLAAHGKPVKPEEYNSDGETEDANYELKSQAKISGTKDAGELSAHLYHHHKSDVGGEEFDDNGSWDEGALKYHHQWLHSNPGEATSKGFEVGHSHKGQFGEFKKNMTPEETHAHLLTSHVGHAAGGSGLSLPGVAQMTPEEAVEAHKKAHDADNAVKWGTKDSDHNLVPKISHTHDLDEDPGDPGEAHYPQGKDLLDHLADTKSHLSKKAVSALGDAFQKNPGLAAEVHKQMHQNYGPAADPQGTKFHVHGPEFDEKQAQHKAVLEHLTKDHGASPDHYTISGKSTEDLITAHQTGHAQIPAYDEPDHTHIGGVAHTHAPDHTADTMENAPKPSEQIIQHLKEHHGATDGDLAEKDMKKLMSLHSAEHGKFPLLKEPEHKHEGLGTTQKGSFPETHSNASMKSTNAYSELKSIPHHELLAGGYDMETHLDAHHPGHDIGDGFDYAPGSEKWNEATKKAHEYHLKAHAEGADHDHGGMPKESSRRILTDLFEEVAR